MRPGLASLKLLSLSLALILAAACVRWPEGTGPNAAPMPLAEALARRDRGEAVLVDVRPPELYAEGHIPGAINVPMEQVEARAAEIRATGKLPILYCG